MTAVGRPVLIDVETQAIRSNEIREAARRLKETQDELIGLARDILDCPDKRCAICRNCLHAVRKVLRMEERL